MNSSKIFQVLGHYIVHYAVCVKFTGDSPVKCITQCISCTLAAVLLICNRLIILSLTDRLCDLRVENVDSFNIVANLYILGSPADSFPVWQ